MTLGEKLKALRLQQGLTLEEVGERVGVGKSTVRKWESGQIANMRRDKIVLVAKALGTTPSYLMGWDTQDVSRSMSDEDREFWELREAMRREPDLRELCMTWKDTPAEELRRAKAVMRALRSTNSENYDGDDPA